MTAYILDTGVRLTHTEFAGRARSGYDFIDKDTDATDCQGHGTHVAGTVAGTTYGVAKGAASCRCGCSDCNGSGSYSAIIAGVDWVTKNAVKPAVANMSLGGRPSATLDAAVKQLDRLRRDLRRGRRQRDQGRLHRVAGPPGRGDHGRRDRRQGRPGVVLELRLVPGHLRARRRHALLDQDQRHRAPAR